MTTLWSVWSATARRQPRKIVVTDAATGRTLTAADLTAAAETVAATIPRGRVVAFNLPNGAEWFIRFLAIQKAGGIAVPVDPSLSDEACARTAQHLSKLRVARSVCCLKLTSGTTGRLRPIPCAPAHLLADGGHVVRTMGIRPRDWNLAMIPLGHSYGLGNLVMPLLQQATPVVCATALLPRHLLELLERYRVTVLPTVPVILQALAQTAGAARPAALRLVISAGAPLAAATAREFHRRFGLRIHNFYGASETGGICYDRTGHATLSGRSVGRPLRGVIVRLRADGRVEVRSRAVARPRHRHVLADRGEWTGRGELRLLGRVDQVANIGGKKVSPAEVELTLRDLRGVTDAWVTVRRDPRGNDYLAAAIETTRARAALEAELGRFLPAWKFPRQYLLRAALPRTGRGKLDTRVLSKLQTSAHRRSGGPSRPLR